MSAPSQFAAAIAQAEGYGVAGALPTRNNNPGDLKGWPGVPADANGYSVFPTAQAGWNALQQQLDDIAAGESSYYTPDMTIAQMGQIWAGGDPNWAANVAAALGVSTSAMIGSFLGMAPGYAVTPPQPVSPTEDSPYAYTPPSSTADWIDSEQCQVVLMIGAIFFGALVIRRMLA